MKEKVEKLEEEKKAKAEKAAEEKRIKEEEAKLKAEQDKLKQLVDDKDKIIGAYFKALRNKGLTKFVGQGHKAPRVGVKA